jgi:hypothetical protein
VTSLGTSVASVVLFNYDKICKIIAAERTDNPQHARSTASPSLTTEIVVRVVGIIASCLCGHTFKSLGGHQSWQGFNGLPQSLQANAQ